MCSMSTYTPLIAITEMFCRTFPNRIRYPYALISNLLQHFDLAFNLISRKLNEMSHSLKGFTFSPVIRTTKPVNLNLHKNNKPAYAILVSLIRVKRASTLRNPSADLQRSNWTLTLCGENVFIATPTSYFTILVRWVSSLLQCCSHGWGETESFGRTEVLVTHSHRCAQVFISYSFKPFH